MGLITNSSTMCNHGRSQQQSIRLILLIILIVSFTVALVTSLLAKEDHHTEEDQDSVVPVQPTAAIPAVQMVGPEVQSLVKMERSYFERLASHLRGTKYTGANNYVQYSSAYLKLKKLNRVERILPGAGYLGPIINDVTSYRYSHNIKPCAVVKHPQKQKASVFIVVVSNSINMEKRNAIRQSWKQHLTNKLVTDLIDVAGFAFLVGMTDNRKIQDRLHLESMKHKDIIQVDVFDSKDRITQKTIAFINWVHQFCPQTHYVFKVNDHVYVNVRNLAATLATLSPSDQSIYGKLNGGYAPARKTEDGNLSFKTWPWSKLPKYVVGQSYLISASSISSLLAAVQTTPIFPLEDIYISGLCSPRVGVSLRTSPTWLLSDMTPGTPTPCQVKKSISWTAKNFIPSTMSYFHKITNRFYSNDVRCTIPEEHHKNHGKNGTIDPKETNKFDADNPSNYMASSFRLVMNHDLT